MSQTIFFKIEGHHYQSREPYNDGWDRGDTDGYEWAVSASLSNTRGYPFDQWDSGDTRVKAPLEEFKCGDTIFVVQANYSTGDTFGHDGGNLEIVFVTKNLELAHAVMDEARMHPTPEFSYNKKKGGEKKGKYFSSDTWLPWNGYFEYLEDIKITPMILES